ncbi:rod shape-determining protein MreC [Proteinivorax hydrogeniformans]|uniref:Cell shape-determining protein MreC n=1 Tax=Proteinivorax hydrogeniformans TaxID=1826727 RepID=A0AAU8HWK7_9FIRM
MGNIQPRYKKIINIVIIFIILSLIMSWSTNDSAKVSFIEQSINQLVLPFQKAMTYTSNAIGDTFYFFSDLRNVYGENKVLKEELNRLSHLEAELDEVRQENSRLYDLLDFHQSHDYTTTPARVISRSQQAWYSNITIDKGSAHGIEKDMPVVTDAGLVGRVVEVSYSTSKVMLAISPNSRVSGLVQRSRDNTLVTPHEQTTGYLQASRMFYDGDVEVGDKIITSDLTGVFPKGIVIGEVVDLVDTPNAVEKTAVLKPAVDFERLEEVLIVVDYVHATEELEGEE